MRGVLQRAMRALTVGAVLASSPVRGDQISIESKDGRRTAILVPAGPDPAPTIIVLHGATIGAEWTMRGSGFSEAARTRAVDREPIFGGSCLNVSPGLVRGSAQVSARDRSAAY